MKKCAFLTLCERGDFVIDDEHAFEPLADLGWKVSTVSWRQTHTAWSEFDLVVIRSTWDYWNDVPAFLDVLGQIDLQTRLANPLSLVRWNLSKTYLRELQGKGIGIVPTLWPEVVSANAFESFFDELNCDELVIKPVVGANGEDTFRISADESPRQLARLSERFDGRAAMVQRFMPAILSEGEYSLFFFSGAFSHAILKRPAESEFRSQEERGAEIQPIVPESLLLLRGQQALRTLFAQPLYARIDFVRDRDAFVVMELELIEPSLYLRTDSESPARFARAIDERFG